MKNGRPPKVLRLPARRGLTPRAIRLVQGTLIRTGSCSRGGSGSQEVLSWEGRSRQAKSPVPHASRSAAGAPPERRRQAKMPAPQSSGKPQELYDCGTIAVSQLTPPISFLIGLTNSASTRPSTMQNAATAPNSDGSDHDS